LTLFFPAESKPANSEQHYPEANKRQTKKLLAETEQGAVKVNVIGEQRGTLPPYRRKERGEGEADENPIFRKQDSPAL
jgi:hypothetical protein